MEATILVKFLWNTRLKQKIFHTFLTNLSNFSLWVILLSFPSVEIHVYLQIIYTWINLDWGWHSVTSVSINVTSIVIQSCWFWSSGGYLPNVPCLCQAKSQLYHRGFVGKEWGLHWLVDLFSSLFYIIYLLFNTLRLHSWSQRATKTSSPSYQQPQVVHKSCGNPRN